MNANMNLHVNCLPNLEEMNFSLTHSTLICIFSLRAHALNLAKVRDGWASHCCQLVARNRTMPFIVLIINYRFVAKFCALFKTRSRVQIPRSLEKTQVKSTQ